MNNVRLILLCAASLLLASCQAARQPDEKALVSGSDSILAIVPTTKPSTSLDVLALADACERRAGIQTDAQVGPTSGLLRDFGSRACQTYGHVVSCEPASTMQLFKPERRAAYERAKQQCYAEKNIAIAEIRPCNQRDQVTVDGKIHPITVSTCYKLMKGGSPVFGQ